MAVPFGRSVICPDLIGRSVYLQSLYQAIDLTRRGNGQTIFISGEAGIGKSRLTAEVKKAAVQQGFLILQGNCFQPDSAYPYAPLLDLLRPYLSELQNKEEAYSWSSIALELARLLLELDPLSPYQDYPTTDKPDQHKRRLLTALLTLFSHIAAIQPLLVIIEDIHWSDDNSLEFLYQLARWGKTHPGLLLATYRSDETRPALRHWLAQLDQAHFASEISLVHLTRAEVAEMLRVIFESRRPVREEFLNAIFTLTDGNPFFIEEILKSMAEAGDISYDPAGWDRKPPGEMAIPRSIQDAVLQRVDQLSGGGKQTAVMAAVAGRRFDFELLQALTGKDEDRLLGDIKELIGAQLVVEESAERFAFRHALTREAINAELLIRERASLHQRIAETIERLHAGSLEAYVSELAIHYYQASQWEKALDYNWRAGQRARQLYASQSAIEAYNHALEAAHHLDGALPPGLYRERAEAYQTLGQFEMAQADFVSAIRIATANQDLREEWQALLDLGRLWTERDYPKAIHHLKQALELAHIIQDPDLLAHTLNPIGNWYTNMEQPLEAIRYHKEALALFEQLDSKPGLAETLSVLGFTYCFTGDMDQGESLRNRAIALFRELDDRQGLVDAYCSTSLCSPSHITDLFIPSMFTLDDAIRQLEIALRMAEEINFPSGEAWALSFLHACVMSKGDYAQALKHGSLGLAISEEIGQRELICTFHMEAGALYLDLLNLERARQELELALSMSREAGIQYTTNSITGLLVSVLVQQGLLDLAQHKLDEILDDSTPQITDGQRRYWYGRAIIALARRNAPLALDILDQLAASAPNSSSGQVIPVIEIQRGDALTRLGRFEEAETALIAARTTALKQGVGPQVWRLNGLLSKLYHRQGRHKEADGASRQAQMVIATLAANIPDETVRANFMQGAQALLPAVRSLTSRQSTRETFGGLTAREREVARLVARGMTNRQISEALFISEETATVHVKHILSKLNFTSRAQIAGWVIKKNL